MGLQGDRFKVATCAASTAIWIATCGRPDVADVKKVAACAEPLTDTLIHLDLYLSNRTRKLSNFYVDE